MTTPTGKPKSTSALLSMSPVAMYVIVTLVAFVAVLGALSALGGFAGGGPTSIPTYSVTFQEKGLPSGTSWSVTLNGSQLSSTNSTIVFSEPSGNYSYTVYFLVSGVYTNTSGFVDVNGAAVAVTVHAPHTGIPIGTAFAVGNAALSTCPTDDTYATNGCAAGDATYTLTVESSAVRFGDVLFVVKTATGNNYTIPTGEGGFSLINITSGVAAQVTPVPTGGQLAMNATWNVYMASYSSSTPLTSLFTIVIDMGTTNTAGLGLSFLVYGTGPYTGTAVLSLP